MSCSNTFKYRATGLASGTSRCSCSQTFEHESDRDWDMKLRMHKKFWDKGTNDMKIVGKLGRP